MKPSQVKLPSAIRQNQKNVVKSSVESLKTDQTETDIAIKNLCIVENIDTGKIVLAETFVREDLSEDGCQKPHSEQLGPYLEQPEDEHF